MRLKMTDLFLACKIPLNLDSYKIHLATGNKPTPLEAFFKGEFKEWQEHQTRGNFTREMVVGLIAWSPNQWLFAGVYRIIGHEKKSAKHVEYSTELLPGQDDLIGRLIVEHARVGRPSYLVGMKDGGDFYVGAIREKIFSVNEFPGYNSVCIAHSILKIVVEQQVQSWVGALANIKGIYLIADKLEGKRYVGSAIGVGGIWQRWAAYSQNGHGENKELKELLKRKGSDYCYNFQYSILEIADSHTSDEQILGREAYWKEVLMTRVPFGYNGN